MTASNETPLFRPLGSKAGVLLFMILLCFGRLPAGQHIHVVAPNGGEVFHAGDAMNIRLTADTTVTSVTVWLSVDDGNSFLRITDERIEKDRNPFWGTFAWDVSDSVFDSNLGANISIFSNECRVRIYDSYNGDPDANNNEDMSDATFSIGPVSAEALPVRAMRPFAVFPNPVLSGGDVSLVIPGNSAVRLGIYSGGGALVDILSVKEHAVWNTGRLPSGTYFIKAFDGRQAFFGRIILQK